MSDTMTDAELTLERGQLHAEIAKLIAEAAEINSETRWYPILVGSSLLGAGATIATIALKLFT